MPPVQYEIEQVVFHSAYAPKYRRQVIYDKLKVEVGEMAE